MISKLKISVVFFSLLFCFAPFLSNAQDSVTLSISPTIYDMSAEPGQEWRSTLKIVNINKFDLTVYAEVVNFAPQGEGGDGRFFPVDATLADGSSLAEWFTISRDPIIIPREKTVELPFTVKVPDGASPGGHFAAILVGTKPLVESKGESKLQTAQIVTSLFFAKVAGDIIESGTIREFTTTASLLSSPEATFSLRFENKGNVHLQPQGDIKIYNMWGEERGIIPINQYTNFGNVLPNSIRKFLLTWKGEWSASDIGRYSAVATIGYGTDNRQFTSSKTYFWVLPFKLLFGIALGLVIFFGLLTWLVRLYVKHMLKMAGIDIQNYQSVQSQSQPNASAKKKTTIASPVQAGILDLTKRMKASTTLFKRVKELLNFIIQYHLFFLAVTLIILFIIAMMIYIKSAHTGFRAYEVVYRQNDNATSTAINSEEIIYNQLLTSEPANSIKPESEKSVAIAIVNRSGVPGAGAKMKLRLEKEGYSVASLEANFTEVQTRTVIITDTINYDFAALLSKILNSSPVSIDTESIKPQVTIFVGSDLSK